MSLMASASTVSITPGFTAWYVKWASHWTWEKQPLSAFSMYDYYPLYNQYSIKINPNAMYGPYVDISLPHGFSITSKFLYGRFTGKKKEQYMLYLVLIDKIGYITRYDSNTILRYAFNDLVNVFMGFEYSHYNYNILRISSTIVPGYIYMAGKGITEKEFNEYNPFIGLGMTIPAIKNTLTIKIDASLMYCNTKEVAHDKYFIGRSVLVSYITYIPPNKKHQRIHKIGTDATLDFVYHTPVLPFSISLGFRYKMLKNLDEKAEKEKMIPYDHIYGLTASVDYKFSM